MAQLFSVKNQNPPLISLNTEECECIERMLTKALTQLPIILQHSYLTFCVLQNPEDGYSRLKRWIMIGDHHQLPPVIKNMAFQKYSNMEQSLFTRFVRLGVPTVDLDAQGRARARSVQLTTFLKVYSHFTLKTF